MVHIEKRYFTLRETAARWGVTPDDLAYMAENDELKVSVRLYWSAPLGVDSSSELN